MSGQAQIDMVGEGTSDQAQKNVAGAGDEWLHLD